MTSKNNHMTSAICRPPGALQLPDAARHRSPDYHERRRRRREDGTSQGAGTERGRHRPPPALSTGGHTPSHARSETSRGEGVSWRPAKRKAGAPVSLSKSVMPLHSRIGSNRIGSWSRPVWANGRWTSAVLLTTERAPSGGWSDGRQRRRRDDYGGEARLHSKHTHTAHLAQYGTRVSSIIYNNMVTKEVRVAPGADLGGGGDGGGGTLRRERAPPAAARHGTDGLSQHPAGRPAPPAHCTRAAHTHTPTDRQTDGHRAAGERTPSAHN